LIANRYPEKEVDSSNIAILNGILIAMNLRKKEMK